MPTVVLRKHEEFLMASQCTPKVKRGSEIHFAPKDKVTKQRREDKIKEEKAKNGIDVGE